MLGFRKLKARWRLALATADLDRCRDEWTEAQERQDSRRMGIAAVRLRAARHEQLRLEREIAQLRGYPPKGVGR